MLSILEFICEKGGLIMAACIVSFFAYALYTDVTTSEWVCNTEATVLDIVSVKYRTTTVLTDKGEITLDQPTVKNGDVICISGSRVNINER